MPRVIVSTVATIVGMVWYRSLSGCKDHGHGLVQVYEWLQGSWHGLVQVCEWLQGSWHGLVQACEWLQGHCADQMSCPLRWSRDVELFFTGIVELKNEAYERFTARLLNPKGVIVYEYSTVRCCKIGSAWSFDRAISAQGGDGIS